MASGVSFMVWRFRVVVRVTDSPQAWSDIKAVRNLPWTAYPCVIRRIKSLICQGVSDCSLYIPRGD